MQNINRKNLFMISAFVLGIFLIIHYWQSIASLISDIWKAVLPVVVGAGIAYLLNILMSFYEKHYFKKRKSRFGEKSRKAVCLVGAILTVLVVIVLIVSLIVPQLVNCVKLIAQQVPSAVEKLLANENVQRFVPDSIYDWVDNLEDKLKEVDWQSLLKTVSGWLKTGFGSSGGKISSVLSSTVSGVVAFVIGIVFAVYYLACREQVLRNLNRFANHFLKPAIKEKIWHFGSRFNACFHKYVVAQCIEALILGGLCFIGMMIFRLPYSSMISALVCVMALIPIIGGTISAVIGTVMILSVSPTKALVFFIMLMVVQVIEGNVIYPKVVGKSVGAPGLIVFAAVTIGGSIFGIPGMMVSVPAATAVYDEIREYMDKKESEAKESVKAEQSE